MTALAGEARAEGFYLFDQVELRKLESTGCVPDRADQPALHRLHRRGFTRAQIVQAFLDLARYSSCQKRFLESIAAYTVGFSI